MAEGDAAGGRRPRPPRGGGLALRAQSLPSEPIVIGDGRLTIGGDAAVTSAPQDPGFFNYTDYEHSALRACCAST